MSRVIQFKRTQDEIKAQAVKAAESGAPIRADDDQILWNYRNTLDAAIAVRNQAGFTVLAIDNCVANADRERVTESYGFVMLSLRTVQSKAHEALFLANTNVNIARSYARKRYEELGLVPPPFVHALGCACDACSPMGVLS